MLMLPTTILFEIIPPLNGNVFEQSLIFLSAVIGAMAAAIYCSGQPWVRRLLTSERALARGVETRALVEFYQAGLEKTDGSTGVLIFVSLAEHQAVVLADRGIASKLSPNVWESVIQDISSFARGGRLGLGLQKAVEQVGSILAEYFPSSGNNPNELKDQLIIKP
jgi:putative membrane protein